MAAPEQIAQIRADAAARLSRSAPALARSLGIEPPAAVTGEAAKHPALREARTLEALADFIDRAARRCPHMAATLRYFRTRAAVPADDEQAEAASRPDDDDEGPFDVSPDDPPYVPGAIPSRIVAGKRRGK